MDTLEEMERFLAKFNLPKTEPGRNRTRTRCLHRRILSNIQRRTNAYPSKTLKIAKKGTLPNLFFEAIITLIPKADKDNNNNKKLQANITDEHRCKNSQQNFRKQIQQHIQKLIHYDQVDFIPGMQGFFNIPKSVNVMHHINKLKDKNHIIISKDTEKAFDKIQHPFMI